MDPRYPADPDRVLAFAETVRQWARQGHVPEREPFQALMARFDDLPLDYRQGLFVKITKTEGMRARHRPHGQH
jgi:hypothetical protein